MELASMLAGEPFTDHPKSVCRVIAGFLRAYNDAIDRDRRQDLYACAAAVVGTRGSRGTERARIEWMLATLDDLGARWRGRGLRDRLPSRGSCRELIGRRLARTLAASEHGHQRALTLVEELVAIDQPTRKRDEAARVGRHEDAAGRPRRTPGRAWGSEPTASRGLRPASRRAPLVSGRPIDARSRVRPERARGKRLCQSVHTRSLARR
jgi:hypothetical protein